MQLALYAPTVDSYHFLHDKRQLAKGQYKWRRKDNTAYVVWHDTKPVHLLSAAFDPTVGVEIEEFNDVYSDWSRAV